MDGGAVVAKRTKQSREEDQKLIERLNACLSQHQSRCKTRQSNIETDEAFYAGEQWRSEDLRELNDLRAPAVTINEFASHVDAVAGLETTRRFATRYMPRVPEETAAMVGEAMNIAAQQILSECYAEHSISEAFSDCLVTGEGWFSLNIEKHEDPRGKIVVRCEDPLSIRADPMAERPGDWSWVCATRTMIPEAIAAEFGVDVDEVKEAAGGGKKRQGTDASAVVTQIKYERESNSTDSGMKESQRGQMAVQIHRYQYAVWKDCIVAMVDGAMRVYNEREWSELIEQRPELEEKGTESKQRLIHEAWIVGDWVLRKRVAPTKYTFSFFQVRCFTRRGRGENTAAQNPYGLTRKARGIVEFSNKFVSIAVHAMATAPKGSLFAEEGAFEDFNKAQRDAATTGKIVKTRPGGLEKIKEIASGDLPRGVEKLMEVSRQWLPAATGVNLYMLGQVDDLRRTAGSAVQSIMAAGQAVLARPFDGLRLARRQLGAGLLQLMLDTIDPEELKQMVGEELAAKLPPEDQWPDITNFKVEVDEAPASPTEVDRFWDQTTATNLVGQVMQDPELRMPGEVFVDLLPRAVPTVAREKWKAHMKSQAGTFELQQQVAQVTLQIQLLQLQAQYAQMQQQMQGGMPPAPQQQGQGGQQDGTQQA